MTSFDVKDKEGDYGLVPVTTGEVAEAYELVRRDGACLLVWGFTDRDAVAAASRAVLGARLRVQGSVITTQPNSKPGLSLRKVRAKRLLLEPTVDESGEIWSRGSPAWSSRPNFNRSRADLRASLCAQAPRAGGQSYLVDGVALLNSLAKVPERQALYQLLSESRDALGANGSWGYIELPTAGKAPAVDGGAGERYQECVAQWQECIRDAALRVPRFDTPEATVLCIDGYRMLLGREPYAGDRTVYAVSSWTERAAAWPMVFAVQSTQL